MNQALFSSKTDQWATPQKVDKVLKSFQYTNRNFGVILSGEKGIGKSLFAKQLAIRSA